MAKRQAPDTNELLQQPAFNHGMNLLRQEIVLQPSRDIVRARIMEVEPFSELLDKRYIGPFDKIERRPGSLFVIWPHGKPAISVVDDPAKRSLIVMKDFGVNRARMPLCALLTNEEHGNMDPEEMREFVRSLDGVVPGPDATVRLEAARDATTLQIKHLFDEKTPQNSLGRIRLTR